MPSTDPYFANVVLLCHFDGADQQTTTVDSSSFHRTLTPTGSKLVTSAAKFGSSSMSQGVSAYTVVPDSADFDFGAGQFTVEAFVYSTATITDTRCIMGQWATSQLAWLFNFNGPAGTLVFAYSTNGTSGLGVSGTYLPPLNQWVHLAADRDASNVLRIYADGVVIASGTAAATFFNSTSNLYLGNDGFATNRSFNGQIDELRITKGVARYAGAFSPPTAAFSDATDTRLGGLAREALLSGNTAALLMGLAREVLLMTPTVALRGQTAVTINTG